MNLNIRTLAVVAAAAMVAVSAAAQSVYPGQHAGKLKVTTCVPHKAEAFDLSEVRLLPGRVRDNLSRDSAWMANISIDRLTHSFKNNAGIFAGREGGYESLKKYGGWESLDCDLRGHTTGHLMSAYGLMYAATGDELFRLKGDSIVAVLGKVQDALGNGYVSAFPEELINRNLRGEGVWAPWYTLHKILSGLIDQYLYGGNSQALEIAVKMGDWAHGKLIGLPEETRAKMLRNEFGGVNEAFYNLYSVTGNPKYRELAEFFYHNDVIDPLAEGNTDFGKKHTNTFIPKVIGEARNYELTGSARSGGIAGLFWNEMTRRHCFANGSLSQKEHYFDPAKMSEFVNGYTVETYCKRGHVAAVHTAVGKITFKGNAEFLRSLIPVFPARSDETAHVHEAVFFGRHGHSVGEGKHFAANFLDGLVGITLLAGLDEVCVRAESKRTRLLYLSAIARTSRRFCIETG